MISKFFIERPILANVIAIITVLLGAISLYNLPVSKYPNIVPPSIQKSIDKYPASDQSLFRG